MTSPATLPSNGCPAYFVSAGFGSNVSTWLTPPLMNREITAVARGLKCGALAAFGLKPIGLPPHAADSTIASASNRSWFSKYASASPLTPPPERNRKSRRDQHVLHLFMSSAPDEEIAVARAFQARVGGPERAALQRSDFFIACTRTRSG